MNNKHWILGLALASLTWAALSSTADEPLENNALSVAFHLGLAIGRGGPVFLVAGFVSLLVYIFSKKTRVALWTWTVVLFATMLLLDIGSIQIQRLKHLPGDQTEREVTVEQAVDLIERGCAGAIRAMVEEAQPPNDVKGQAFSLCLLGAAASMERQLSEAEVSAQVRAKFGATIREIKRRAGG